MYQSQKIDTPRDFDSCYDWLRKNSDHLIFRGVREAKYKNYTSGQRAWITQRLSTTQYTYADFIHQMLCNIRNNLVLRDYYLALKVIPNDLLYLSFLQHYGGPTPMLDFTHDLDVALFFAYDGVRENETRYVIGDYVSLYYIDIKECGNELVDMISLYDEYPEKIAREVESFKTNNPNATVDDSLIRDIDKYVTWGGQGGFSNVPLGLYDGIFSQKAVNLPLSGQSLVWANLNLIAQKGCFLCYTKSSTPVEEHLSSYKYLPKMHCVDIPKSYEEYISTIIHKRREEIYPQEEDIAKMSFQEYLGQL